MLIDSSILKMILQSEKDCEKVFEVLKKSKRDKHGKICSINIPKDAEQLFWRLIMEFETLHFKWGDWDIASSYSHNADINDIVCGKSGFENTCLTGYFALHNEKENRFGRIEIPQDISVEYKLLFYYSSSKKEIVIKRNPPIRKASRPKFDYTNVVLYVKRKKIDLEPSKLALYVLFLEKQNIKLSDISKHYKRYYTLWNAIKERMQQQKEYPYSISEDGLRKNIDRYISEINNELLAKGVLPIYFIRQYTKCKNNGENYFLTFDILNNDNVKRK